MKNEIRAAIGDISPFEVIVKKDVFMLPSLVDPNSEIVRGLQKAIHSIDGKEADFVYGKGSYDAGGPTIQGIPTVMYGRPDHGTTHMGEDFVSMRG